MLSGESSKLTSWEQFQAGKELLYTVGVTIGSKRSCLMMAKALGSSLTKGVVENNTVYWIPDS